ncbi:TRAP transporter substrate-binding protein [Brevibacillus marinus]|uniref:TRAP transporter substrate-binding protein n=1 Tax=Brevibacillus marinus TaxID=2496837 RepID=UPI0013DF1810|nr:TRAP transporter substrate-binding protein [Brevibacillus marinus]
MRRTHPLLGVLVLLLSLILGACGGGSDATAGQQSQAGAETGNSAQEKRTFKVAFSGGQSHVHYKAMEVFKRELEEKSNGRFEVEFYPESTLGTDAEVMNQLKSGSLDMGIVISGELANHSSSFNAWFMPFLFPDAQAAYEMGITEEAKALFDSLPDAGVVSLGYLVIEMRDVLSKDSLIENLDDLQGTNIRVTPSPAIVDFWQTFGANPTPIDFTEIYSAFQTGVINVLDSGPTSIVNGKYHEIGKYYTQTKHMAFTSSGLVSEKVWNEMSADDQQLIQDAFELAQKSNVEVVTTVENESLELMKQGGVTIGTLQVTEEGQRKISEFYDKYTQGDEKIKAFVDKAKQLASQ